MLIKSEADLLPKQKTCRYCKKKFRPKLKAAIVCSQACAADLIQKRQARFINKSIAEDRRETKKRLLALKTRKQWLDETQIVFNRAIRARDFGLPCISCDKPMYKKINAGHYRTVKAAPHLRFNGDNCHAQCEACNTYLSGNIGNYRINLVKRIGVKRVEAIECDNEPKHYTIDDLIELKAFYKAKLKVNL